MLNQFSRTQLLLGKDSIERLQNSRVAITHDRRRALSSWRISLSHLTTEQDIGALIKALQEIMEHEVGK